MEAALLAAGLPVADGKMGVLLLLPEAAEVGFDTACPVLLLPLLLLLLMSSRLGCAMACARHGEHRYTALLLLLLLLLRGRTTTNWCLHAAAQMSFLRCMTRHIQKNVLTQTDSVAALMMMNPRISSVQAAGSCRFSPRIPAHRQNMHHHSIVILVTYLLAYMAWVRLEHPVDDLRKVGCYKLIVSRLNSTLPALSILEREDFTG
jgi:hypothetical protein